MNEEMELTEGIGWNFSLLQKRKKEMTALRYFSFVEDANAWSASAEAIADESSFWEGDVIPVGLRRKTFLWQFFKRRKTQDSRPW